jgi:energy-coupling factor transporter transmembrane protein EcfT
MKRETFNTILDGAKDNKKKAVLAVLLLVFLLALATAFQALLAAGVIYVSNIFGAGLEYSFRNIGALVLLFIILRVIFRGSSKE